VKEIFVFPVIGPARFDRARLVRLGEFAGHLVRVSVTVQTERSRSAPRRTRRTLRLQG
jgi:hypothetical protein